MKQSLDEYLTEINREELLGLEEEQALVEAIQQKGPDCEEKERLVKCFRRFVTPVVRQYLKRGLTVEELIEAGNKGLAKAVEKYVPDADSKFITYAVWWIRQSIIQAIEEKNSLNVELKS